MSEINQTNTMTQTKDPESQFNRTFVSRLSNQELESKLKNLVMKERSLLHLILEHIKEVATRRLYLERAYPSLFEYLVKELGYSGSAAMRRIEAARLLKEVPAVAQKIQEGSLNLSQIGELSRAIKEKEKTTGEKISTLWKENLLAAISGKSTQETQRELYTSLDIQIQERERQRVQKDDSVRLELTFSKEQYAKLSQCRDLLAHVLQQNQRDSSWASVMETLADQYLNRKAGAAGKKVIDRGNVIAETEVFANEETNAEGVFFAQEKAMAQEKVVTPQEVIADAEVNSGATVIADATVEGGNSHYRVSSVHGSDRCGRDKVSRGRSEVLRTGVCKSLTPKMKATVFKRDRCCQFIDPLTRKKCGGTFGLQIDHRTSLWAGGDHAQANLQVLCQWHNRLKYQKESGICFV